jgi:dethiobiotin synthetase
VSYVVVAGTGTGVGKTYVTAATTRTLQARGVRVAVRKPVQSFAPDDAMTDVDILAAASGEDPKAVCPPHRRYEIPMAPPMAADALGLTAFSIADLVAELDAPEDTIVLVESAGGVRSPLAADGDTIDLVDAIRPELVVLVADAGLGTINAVRMSAAALGTHPTVVFLNRFDPGVDLHERNANWLRTQTRLHLVTDVETLVTLLVPGG